MDAKLMGAACYRSQLQQGMAAPVAKHTIMRPCWLAVLAIDHLSGTVVDVWSQGQVDVTLLSLRHLVLQQSMIDLMDAVMQEEVLQLVALLFCEGNEHEPAGVHIEAMHDERPRGRRETFAHSLLHAWLVILAWHREQTCGLTHDGQLLIIIYNV